MLDSLTFTFSVPAILWHIGIIALCVGGPYILVKILEIFGAFTARSSDDTAKEPGHTENRRNPVKERECDSRRKSSRLEQEKGAGKDNGADVKRDGDFQIHHQSSPCCKKSEKPALKIQQRDNGARKQCAPQNYIGVSELGHIKIKNRVNKRRKYGKRFHKRPLLPLGNSDKEVKINISLTLVLAPQS